MKGLLPVVPTPFHEGRVDVDSYADMLEWCLPELDGVTALGSTGEAPSMTMDERIDATRAIGEMVPRDKTLVVGVADACLTNCLRLTATAARAGAKAALLPAPFYFPIGFDGALSFFRAFDAASDLPWVLYDNPYTTKLTLSTAQVLKVAEACPKMVGLKLTDQRLSKIDEVGREAPVTGSREGGARDMIRVFAGEDALAYRSFAMGVDGFMIIAPMLFPKAFRRLLALGPGMEGMAYFSRHVLPFIHMFGLGNEVAYTKTLLQELGVIRSAEVRAPIIAADGRLTRHAYELCMEGIE